MARKPTPQQAAVIEAVKAEQAVKVEACAGGGKTSTLTLVAEAVPVPSIYWCFNKANADEAAEKFPKHVKCSTSHSTAFSFTGKKIMHKLKRPAGKYVNVAGTGAEIGKYLKLSPIEMSEDLTLSQAYLGLLVRTTVTRFEQSADAVISQAHLPKGELRDITIKTGVKTTYVETTILKGAKKLWEERINPASPVLATHDTYLKMYQLSKPVLGGNDVLYVDEFQDTTPCVLDIVKNQMEHMKVVMCGDRFQSIYQWRGAINAMKMVECATRGLTKSFRYGQAVADVATTVLEGQMVVTGNETINSVVGIDTVDRTKPHTRLFRTNAALLVAAMDEILKGTPVSIEIDVKDFVKLLQSAVALKEGDMKAVKHDKLVPFFNWWSLTEEAKHDAELARIAKIVDSKEAGEWISTLETYVNSKTPHVTFTTAHKSKGREFDQVVIEGDFKSCYNEKGEWIGLTEEEQNLLYVAVTRAVHVLEYNNTVYQYIKRREEEGLTKLVVELEAA